jgi:hypothetical protein
LGWKEVTGQHNGTVSVKGYFNLQGDKLAGGNFTVDMQHNFY